MHSNRSLLSRFSFMCCLFACSGLFFHIHACGTATHNEPSTQSESIADSALDAAAIEAAPSDSVQRESQVEPVVPDGFSERPFDVDIADKSGDVERGAEPASEEETTFDGGVLDAGELAPEQAATDTSGADVSPPDKAAPTRPVWLGVGNFGLRAYSFDGLTWQKQGGTGSGNQHTDDLLRGVAYGDGVFVAVGGNNNSHIIRSTDGGKTWKDVGFATGGWLGGVVYADGVWFAAKGYDAHVLRSDDKGLTWKPVDMGKSQVRRSSGIRSMDAYQGKILSFGDKGTLYVSHDKGLTWLDHSFANMSSGLAFVVYFKGDWYAGGGSYCGVSKDLKAWKPCPFTLKEIYEGAVSGGQLTIFHNDRYDTRYTFSTDGIKWTEGKAAVYSAYEANGLWIGMRYGAVYTGPSLDKLKKQSASPGGFRDWVVGFVP